jgi:HK97 family phage portal protein
VRVRLSADDVRDVETRYADLSAFIPHPGSTNFINQPVTSEDAVSNTIAVYACVSLIAGTIGSLEMSLYREAEGQVRQKIAYDTALQGLSGRGYPGTLARVLGEVPNPEQTPVEFWETVVGHIELQGEAFVNVVRGPDGRPSELWLLRPDRMEIFRNPVTKRRFYVYEQKTSTYSEQGSVSSTTKRIRFEADEIMHIPGLTYDGMHGISPISVARKAIQGEQGASTYADSFYRNAAMPSGIVTVPKGPADRFSERAKMYRDALQSKYGGMSNAGRLAVVEEGVTWQQTGMTMVDQQFIEQRQWSVVEIARLFGVPPHLIGDVERSTSWGTGIEEQTLGFLTYKLRPIIERIEAAISRDLGLVPGVKTLADEHLCAEFDVEEILRTNTKARYEAYATGIQWGFLTRADIRSWENLDPIEGLEKPTFPANMQIIGDEPPVQPAATFNEAMAALMAREQIPPVVNVTNTPSEQSGGLTEAVEGLRNELRATELLGRVKDDLEAIHTLSNEAHESFEATRLAAQDLADSTAAAVDRSAAATEALAAESRAVQTELFTELEALKQPRKRLVERDEDGFITAVTDVLDSETTVSP